MTVRMELIEREAILFVFGQLLSDVLIEDGGDTEDYFFGRSWYEEGRLVEMTQGYGEPEAENDEWTFPDAGRVAEFEASNG